MNECRYKRENVYFNGAGMRSRAEREREEVEQGEG